MSLLVDIRERWAETERAVYRPDRSESARHPVMSSVFKTVVAVLYIARWVRLPCTLAVMTNEPGLTARARSAWWESSSYFACAAARTFAPCICAASLITSPRAAPVAVVD